LQGIPVFGLNAIRDAPVLSAMKSILSAFFVAASVLMLAACGSPATPPAGGRPVRTGSGNADLQGPTADDVIWQSTHQWHADRRHDRRRW